MKPKHSHDFVENYEGLVGFGLDRETDESTVKVYLQKFSDDRVLDVITARLSDEELADIFFKLSKLMKHHLSENEYHELFLRDD